MISTIMIKLHSTRLWEFSIISKQALWLSSPRRWEGWCWLCSNTKLVGEKSGAHIALLQKHWKCTKLGGCRAKYTIAATIIWRACLLRGDHRFWGQPSAFVVLAMRKPPASVLSALLCILYQIFAHISTAEVLFRWWGQMCVGEVVKRVMSPNVNRWCLMSLTFIWCHWWNLNHACSYIQKVKVVSDFLFNVIWTSTDA